MWRREGVRRLAAAVAAAVLLAGCATVPTSGPVREHESDGQEIQSGVKVAPVPPAVDASPMLVVEGFLHAMGTDQPGFAVARQYLTPSADAAWHPESGTLIYADGHQPREADTGTEERPAIILEAVLTGTLSASGEYREAGGGHRHDFGLQEIDGQWRISRPPDGLLISRYHFQTNYSALNLHYMDATGSVLVPDPRYFALNAISPSAVMNAQLGGPAEWLAPAVRKPPWSASIVDDLDLLPQGVAVLRLRPEAAELSDPEVTALMAEFTATLTMLPQVAGVQFSVGGSLLTLPGTRIATLTSADLTQLAPSRAGGRLLTVRDQVVHLTDPQEPWSEGQAIARGLTAPGTIAARADLTEIAAVNPEGTRLAVANAEAETETVLWESERLLRPDYSRQDELWAIGDGTGVAGFRVYAAVDRAILPVSVGPDFPSDTVRAFRLSPDGTRIALVLDGPLLDGVPVEQVGLARVVRGADGIAIEAFRPVTVSPPAEAARRILDVGWQTATELLVLVSHRVTPTASVVEVDQDSARAEDIGPSDVTGLSELAVAPGGQPVLRGIGAVYRFEGPFNWELTDLTAEAVTYS